MYNQYTLLPDGSREYKIDGKMLLSQYSGWTPNNAPRGDMYEMFGGAQSGKNVPNSRSPEGINPIALAVGICKGTALPVRFMHR